LLGFGSTKSEISLNAMRNKIEALHVAAHEAKHGDVPEGMTPIELRSVYQNDISREDWLKQQGKLLDLRTDKFLKNQARAEENRAESGIYELFLKDPNLKVLPQKDILDSAQARRPWYVNTVLGKDKQFTSDETRRFPVNSAFVEGSIANFQRNANRGTFVNPKTKEPVRQYNMPGQVDEDVLYTHPHLNNLALDRSTGKLQRVAMVLSDAHAKQVRDMQDYYDPKGSVRQRSYQWNPQTKQYDIVAPQFLIKHEDSALQQFDKDIPDERRWMFSPANIIANPKQPIITHSGYLAEQRTDAKAVKSNKSQSPDINKRILLNPDKSRETALMLSYPKLKWFSGYKNFPQVPTGHLTDNNGNPLPTNEDVDYSGPPTPLPPLRKTPSKESLLNRGINTVFPKKIRQP
jgi:hypothetical protein